MKKDAQGSEQDKADKRKAVLESIVEGRKMEAYAEHRTKEMHACWFCGTICYRKKPVKNIGTRWVCIDCLKELKEALETLSQWEESLALQKEIVRQVDEGLNPQ